MTVSRSNVSVNDPKSSRGQNSSKSNVSQAAEDVKGENVEAAPIQKDADQAPDRSGNPDKGIQNIIPGLLILSSLSLKGMRRDEKEDYVLELAQNMLKYQGHDAAMDYLATVTGSGQLSTDAANRVYKTLLREEEKMFPYENLGEVLF